MIALPSTVKQIDSIASELGANVAELGRIPVIVSDPTLLAAGVVDPVQAALGCDVVTVPGGEPVSSSVGELAKQLAAGSVDAVVAVGGGSVIDTAKLGARLIADPAGLVRRLRSAEEFEAGAPVIAMPTTSGAGAEVTRTAIVTHQGHKTWAWDERLRPELAILAPELTAATPRPIAVAAGLDALVHAVEAGTGRRSTPEITGLGSEAAAVLVGALADAIRDPGEVEARSAVMRAATAAGIAIDHCGTGIGHAVGHALGSVGSIPHGLAVMLGLRAGLEWTLVTAADRYAPYAAAVVPGGAVAGFAAAIDGLLDAVGFWEELAKWERPDAESLAVEMMMADHQPMCANNARPIAAGDIADVAALVVEAWPR